MKQKERLEKAAKEHGATVWWGELGFNVDAPRGFVWRDSGTSTLAHDFANGAGQSWLVQEVTEVKERMAEGLEPAPPGYEGWWAE